MLGILLRAPWQAIRKRIHRELVAAGYGDVRPRDLAVLQWPGPDGMRQIDVAANAGMSKQAVKPLIDHLEQCGYLERVPDPDDHRAQRIRTTWRGKQLMRTAAAIITGIDQGSRTSSGPRRTPSCAQSSNNSKRSRPYLATSGKSPRSVRIRPALSLRDSAALILLGAVHVAVGVGEPA